MGPLLNKRLPWVITLVMLVSLTFGQQQNASTIPKDYKDPKTHEKFRKRRMAVSAWQINQLKRGALVVRLKTNNLLISQLKKRGDDHLAEKARLEQAAININTMRAYLNHYKFSKVYFIYSHSTDSLLTGTRSGIFADTSLQVNPSIRMNEDFYLLAETDFVYNSSIGFIREDSARHVVEAGNPSSSEFPIVVKNKYGHQLKGPFPYSTNRLAFTQPLSTVHIYVNGVSLNYGVSSLSSLFSPRTEGSTYSFNGKPYELTIPRSMTYQVLSMEVEEFDRNLEEFYRRNPEPSQNSANYMDAKPFLY